MALRKPVEVRVYLLDAVFSDSYVILVLEAQDISYLSVQWRNAATPADV